MRVRLRRGFVVGFASLCVVGQPMAAMGADTPSAAAAKAFERVRSDDPYERKKGLLQLEALREPATIEAIAALTESSDPDMRADSLRALAAIEGVQAVPRLLKALTDDTRPRVRWSVVLALEPFQTSDPKILTAFIEAMRDYSTEVRMAAVDVVSRVDHPDAREAIRTRYRKELRPDVRRVLKLALRRIGE